LDSFFSYTFSITVAESYYGFSVKDWQKTMACSPHGYECEDLELKKFYVFYENPIFAKKILINKLLLKI
jgi:hypothetical protein